MASPQTTATTTTTSPRSAPARTGAIFGIVGAVLAIVGFFLPWTIQANGVITGPDSSISYSTVSGWNLITSWLNGSAFTFPRSPGSPAWQGGNPLYSIALIAAVPLLLAVVVLVVCAISLFRRPGPVLSGLFVSAAFLGLLSVFQVSPSAYLNIALIPGNSQPAVSSWGAIGIDLLYLGYFGLFAGWVIAALSTRQSASQG